MDTSRQMLLGVGVFLGGAVLLYAMTQQIDVSEKTQVDQLAQVKNQVDAKQPSLENEAMLTADIDTETRILAEKRRERELRVSELDKKAKDFLEKQERAEMLAMEKARLENQKYRNNAIEPVMDEQVIDNIITNDERINESSIVTKPIIVARKVEPEPDVNQPALESEAESDASAKTTLPTKPKNRTSAQTYIVKRGDGLIKLSRRYSVPLDAIMKANGFDKTTRLKVGQKVVIPSSQEVKDLKASSNNSKQEASVQTDNDKLSNASKNLSDNRAPDRQFEYKVARGEGLIRLARRYNVPVAVLAKVNNLNTNTSLRVGQTLKIPSKSQIARLEREAQIEQRAKVEKQEAQNRLREARRKASNDGLTETFGVQVALANNQAKADEVVKRMQAAGYKAKTSKTSRGVRVIIGPEKSKDAALALRDKVNADSKAGVNGAWVLDWR